MGIRLIFFHNKSPHQSRFLPQNRHKKWTPFPPFMEIAFMKPPNRAARAIENSSETTASLAHGEALSREASSRGETGCLAARALR
jgi:hypothetical protein